MHAIAQNAFRGCGLENLTLPGMERFYGGAFQGCHGLRQVRFTADIERITGNPFEDCESLSSFIMEDDVSNLIFENGKLIHETIDVVSPIFSASGQEEKTTRRKVICALSR